jgi:hypothetical protein
MTPVQDLVDVTSVEVVGDYRLRLTFADGTAGEVDFTNREWRGVFEPLRDPAFFARSRSMRTRARSLGPEGSTWRQSRSTRKPARTRFIAPQHDAEHLAGGSHNAREAGAAGKRCTGAVPKMGGTGLEPVTPSLSRRHPRSRALAAVTSF